MVWGTNCSVRRPLSFPAESHQPGHVLRGQQQLQRQLASPYFGRCVRHVLQPREKPAKKTKTGQPANLSRRACRSPPSLLASFLARVCVCVCVCLRVCVCVCVCQLSGPVILTSRSPALPVPKAGVTLNLAGNIRLSCPIALGGFVNLVILDLHGSVQLNPTGTIITLRRIEWG